MSEALKTLDDYSQQVIRVVEEVGPAVVSIRTRSKSRHRGPEGAGSGVIIAPDGYLLTNSHVVRGAREIEVSRASGELYPAKLVLSQLGFGNCLRKRLRLLPFFRSVDVGGWQPWDENGMWSGWKGKNETSWND